ncbi:MAG: hypothetical protein IJX72_07410 [Clostridia bacterium]|nr:hypothetical protein [Clostridia bacterium]
MKKFLFPLWIFAAYLLGIIACAGIAETFSGDTGYGAIVYMIGVFALYCLLVIPTHCILYSRRVLLCEKQKWLFVPYNAALITLPYALPLLLVEEETLVYGAILFAWGALWTAVPLLFPARRKQPALAS